MIKHTLPVLVALVLAACSRAPEAPPQVVEMTGDDQMRFGRTTFEVKAGQKVQVTMKNIGTMPKEAMGHNFVVLNKNTDVLKFLEPGQTNKENDYIAPAQSFRVVAKTKMTGPGESDTVTFTAPSVPGPYDYLCTFPGHYVSGMKGVMTVTP